VRKQICASEVAADPRFDSLRQLASAADISTVWSMPFDSRDGRLLGVVVVFSTSVGPPDEPERRLIERASHLAGIAVERQQAEEESRRSEGILRLVLNALPVGVGVVDTAGNIILSNPAAERVWRRSIQSGPERYLASRGWWHATGKRLAPDEWASVRACTRGETCVNEVVEIEAFDGVRRIIQQSAVPIRDTENRITGAVVVIEDISDRTRAERELSDSYHQMRTLTGRLMHAQDEERRRIARLLHETTAQDLAGLKMHLARLNRTAGDLSESDRGALTDSILLAEQAMTQIRTLSYLLHPPFLDETGLLSALRWFTTGFAERSGIQLEVDLPDQLARMPLDRETALFRVVQESLINIHRHAESETARIRLRRDAETLVLDIEDHGRGISREALDRIMRRSGAVGVGVVGMIERVEQLGGRLDVRSDAHGTTVSVRLPFVADVG
jgi:signal transduction histidine kinase